MTEKERGEVRALWVDSEIGLFASLRTALEVLKVFFLKIE